MFTLPIMLVVTGVFVVIQVSLWKMLPEKLRNLLMANPIFAFLINLVGSNFILAFTGIASLVGICNLFASVAFGVYAKWYSKNKGITGIKIGWNKLFNAIPIFPRLDVVYNNRTGATV